MKTEYNSIMGGSAMAVFLGVVGFIGCWFVPINFFAKLLFAIIFAFIFFTGLKNSKG